MRKNSRRYRLFLCFDFPDDLAYTSFTRQSLEKLFHLYQRWGVERIYWIYTWRHSERLWACAPNKSIVRNYAITRRNLGEFLPTAVKIAHKLGLEFYAVYKPFDMAFDETFPFNTPQAKKFGRMDDLSGRVYWTAESVVRYQQYRIQRRWDDIPEDLAKRSIGSIVLQAAGAAAQKFDPKALSLWVSKDNHIFRRYRGRFTCRREVLRGGCIIRLENLRINEPYLDLRVDGANCRGVFVNRLDKLVKIFDEDGRELPFTYGLFSRADRYESWAKAGHGRAYRDDLVGRGYLFGWHNAGVRGFLRATRYALDNQKGFLALAKGKQQYVTGALSPAYPEVRALWLKHIRECLVAGVDGVDLRVANHNRSMEWENYGFEPPVQYEFLRRYGRLPKAGDGGRCQALLGEFYTEFIREAAALIRRYKRRVQLHIGVGEIKHHNFSIKFEWARWLKEKLADEITLIMDYPSHFYRKIAAAAGKRKVPMYFRKYMRGITWRKRWQTMLRRYLRQSQMLGQAGFIIYESAFVVHGRPDGTFEELFPDLPQIFQEELKLKK